MIAKTKKILSSDLVKVFSYTGFSTLIKLITSYVTVKVVASIIGPSGVALVGQLQNFTSIFTTVGAGGINNGVVKYVSEYKEDKTTLQKYLKNGFKLTAYFSGISSLFLIALSTYLSRWVLFEEKYHYLFILFGLNLMLLSFNNFFLSVLNGFKEFKKFVSINIFTNIISLIFTVILVWIYGLKGALISLVTYQGFILLITLFYLKKKSWFSKQLWGNWDKQIVRKYFSYTLMALVTAMTLPVSQLLIRGYIIKEYSITDAGFWEGINKISAMYLMFITTSFSVYYLPKLAEITDNNILRKEIFKTYKIITPLIFITLVMIYLLKDVVINILFTKEFYPMKELFLWQLIGDFFKIMSWLLAFVMVAKSMTKMYIITEILFATSLVLLSYYFIDHFGILGSTQSYCINYFLYFVVMVVVFSKKLKLAR
ncbi:O-antigen translocase [Epilithonimonas zeae]|uniref:Polysaccharide transporter, PST family n=1 Tax=Epilithonimonas zeae TaxID=1416779 RepID=A0A1N6HFA6_9FLAO|nr:O-antigen translocase [Epilithonimonas zeae]SIO18436.1 polysaccharide transporter, PST family [Epilithonimonas zeae]